MILGRGLCGVTYIPHESRKLPDCQVHRVSKKGNFVKCKTLFNVQEINAHIDRHKKSTKNASGTKKSGEMIFDKAAMVLAVRCLPRNFYNNEGRHMKSYNTYNKRGCIFPMVIWPAFRMGQFRVKGHPYHAPQFRSDI